MNSAPKLDKPIDEGGFFNKVWLVWFDRMKQAIDTGFAPANVLGTSSEITAIDGGSGDVTVSLPSAVTFPGSAELDGRDLAKWIATR